MLVLHRDKQITQVLNTINEEEMLSHTSIKWKYVTSKLEEQSKEQSHLVHITKEIREGRAKMLPICCLAK